MTTRIRKQRDLHFSPTLRDWGLEGHKENYDKHHNTLLLHSKEKKKKKSNLNIAFDFSIYFFKGPITKFDQQKHFFGGQSTVQIKY